MIVLVLAFIIVVVVFVTYNIRHKNLMDEQQSGENVAAPLS